MTALYKATEALNEDSVHDLQAERLRGERPGLPVLLVWGEKDRWTPLAMGYECKDALPGARLQIMNDCGHAPYFENPSRFTEIVDEFLSSQSSKPGATSSRKEASQ